MAQSMIGRLWDRIVDRYDQDSESDCCSATIEEVSSDSSEEESGSCCE